MNELQHRIHGTEMEWCGMTPGFEGDLKLSQIKNDDLHSPILQYLDKEDIKYSGNVVGQFLSNGARFYDDVGDHREYATPEDNSFIGTTANEIAGERIMQGVAEEYLVMRGVPLSYTRRVIDDYNNGSGYHASFCADSKAFTHETDTHFRRISVAKLSLFGVYAATRGVLFGAGALMPGAGFVVAQKSLSLDTDFSDGTTTTKPLVNTRNEQLADPRRYVRIHDTSGDATMSPWATRVKLGSASLVLRMIENGYNLPGLRLGEPGYIVARAVAKDPGLTTVFPLENGSRALSAIEVQQELVNAARKMSSDVELSHEEQWTIDEWDKALSDLAQSPKLTFDRVEWVARLATLNRIHEKQGLGWGSERMRYKDRQFSDITINGIALALRESEKAWAKYMPSEDLIKRRVHDAPTETRANIRGAFIKNMPQNNPGGVSVNWHRIMHHQIPYHLPDPYQVYSRRLASVNYTTW